MMGLTDRVEPWVRRFQRTAGDGPGTDTDPLTELERSSLRAFGDDDAEPSGRRTGRFTRRRVLQEQDG